ncbi:MAG: hypothetical protein ABI268_06110 [Rhodanobacter sp.]
MNAFSYIGVLLLLSGTATAGSVPQRNAQGLLADTAGHTLYRYDRDGNTGHSHCEHSCKAVWPPYLADPGAVAAGDYSLTVRASGHKQWVYQGHPLYLFAGDAKPGDHDGDGVNGSWHVLH